MGGSDGEIQQESTTLDSQTEFAIRIEEPPVDSVGDGETQQESTTSDPEPEVAIEIEESWVDSVKSRANASFVPKWRKEPISIFRVPANLRALHPEAYEPTVVSIGPYHHGKVHLEPMEKHKWGMVRRLQSRRGDEDALRECLRKVKALEERARSYYSEAIDMGSNDFVEMMVLDGCFLIGLLLLIKAMMEEDEDPWVVLMGQKDEEEMHYKPSYLLTTVKHDLLKVENQMPFFVVEALFDLLVLQPDNGPSASISMYDLAETLLNGWNPCNDFYTATINHPKGHHHLLHFFLDLLAPNDHHENSTDQPNLIIRGFLKIKKEIEDVLLQIHDALPSFLIRGKTSGRATELQEEKWTSGRATELQEKKWTSGRATEVQEEKWTLGRIKCATELQEAGVKFVKKEKCSFLDVTFKHGVVEFPILCIFDETAALFHNLIAFEQCYPDANGDITFYAVLMDYLIDTPTDVDVLDREGVLRIGLSSKKEAAQFFNSLCKEVIFDRPQDKLFIELNRYCDSKWHRRRAVLMRDYLSSPWAAISVVAAFILLLLTLLQTVYTVYGSYHS